MHPDFNENLLSKEALIKSCALDAQSDLTSDCIEILQAKKFMCNMGSNTQADNVQSHWAWFNQCLPR